MARDIEAQGRKWSDTSEDFPWVRSRGGFEPKLLGWNPTILSTLWHGLLKSGWADLIGNVEQCLSVTGREGREALAWHWCLLILQNSPACIISHGGGILCLGTEKFKFQPREREAWHWRQQSGHYRWVPSQKCRHTPPMCGRGELSLGKQSCTCAAPSLRARWTEHLGFNGLIGR